MSVKYNPEASSNKNNTQRSLMSSESVFLRLAESVSVIDITGAALWPVCESLLGPPGIGTTGSLQALRSRTRTLCSSGTSWRPGWPSSLCSRSVTSHSRLGLSWIPSYCSGSMSGPLRNGDVSVTQIHLTLNYKANGLLLNIIPCPNTIVITHQCFGESVKKNEMCFSLRL